jgi:hypothetical protein
VPNFRLDQSSIMTNMTTMAITLNATLFGGMQQPMFQLILVSLFPTTSIPNYEISLLPCYILASISLHKRIYAW